MEYPWYHIVEDNAIEQGDLIIDCPIVFPPSEYKTDEVLKLDYNLINTIILSQSCDLVNNKIEFVLVCPYYKLKEYLQNLPEDQQTKKSKEKKIEELKRGNLHGYHLLNKSDNDEIEDYIIVDFRNVYGVQIDVLKQIAKEREKRYRLQPPYREHLSQAFARYFMRVGLPQDIRFEKDYLD